MSITLISDIKQANGGDFALVDSNDIRGGLYTVDTLEEMNLIPIKRVKEGMLCWVCELETFKQYKNGIWDDYISEVNLEDYLSKSEFQEIYIPIPNDEIDSMISDLFK